MKKNAIGLLCVALAWTGCTMEAGPEDFEDVRIQRQEIRGGQFDTSSTAILGMAALTGGVCTGTLIAPNLVLTAQHCIAQVPSQYVQCGVTQFGQTYPARQIFFTTQPQITQNANAYVGSYEIVTPPNGRDMCGYDIALVILRRNLTPAEATPVEPRLDQPPQVGETYTAVGYGHIGDGSGAGARRILGNRRVQCEGAGCPRYVQVTATEFLGTDGTCQGDSGGPALDSEGRVIGALSRGPNGCGAATYSGVARWQEWIRETAARAATIGQYTAPAWVTGGAAATPGDADSDGVLDLEDNCPYRANADQTNSNTTPAGDACDPDDDGDGAPDERDNCRTVKNNQDDSDGDGIGDACDPDFADPNAPDPVVPEDPQDPQDPETPETPENMTPEEDEDFVIFFPEPVEDEACSVSAPNTPAGTPVGLVLGLLGLFGLRRRD